MIFFDMDGVLFDTKSAVKAAYSAVGLNADEAQGRTWREWLVPKYGQHVARQLHEAKNMHYLKMIERDLVPIFPNLNTLRAELDLGHVTGIVTSASEEATRALLLKHLTADQINALHCIVFEAGYMQKKHTLLAHTPFAHVNMARVDERFIYVDDNEQAGCGIVAEVNMRLGYPAWEFLHFDPLKYAFLGEEI